MAVTVGWDSGLWPPSDIPKESYRMIDPETPDDTTADVDANVDEAPPTCQLDVGCWDQVVFA